MEPVGLSIGVLGLATRFNEAISTFNTVQAGRKFGEDVSTCFIKLDAHQLRLSRWGEAVGLSNIQDTATLNQVFEATRDQRRAEMLLGQVLHLFENAEKTSKALQGPESIARDTLFAPDSTDSLSRSMKALAVERQNTAKFKTKAKWALYKKDQFTELIDDLGSLVKDLEQLFPATLAKRQRLAEEEVAQIATTPEDRTRLADIASSPEVGDALLQEAIQKVSGAQTIHNSATFGANNSGTQIGQIAGSSGGTWNIGRMQA